MGIETIKNSGTRKISGKVLNEFIASIKFSIKNG